MITWKGECQTLPSFNLKVMNKDKLILEFRYAFEYWKSNPKTPCIRQKIVMNRNLAILVRDYELTVAEILGAKLYNKYYKGDKQ